MVNIESRVGTGSIDGMGLIKHSGVRIYLMNYSWFEIFSFVAAKLSGLMKLVVDVVSLSQL